MEVHKITVPNEIMLGEVRAMLSEGRQVMILTKGSSMQPFIRGDRDSVRLQKFGDVAVGDMVLAQIAPGRYVLHTIRAIDGEKVTLKGDGNLLGTEVCRLGDVCGTVVAIVRPSGREIDVMNTRFRARAARWRNYPYIVRRGVLAIRRRLKWTK